MATEVQVISRSAIKLARIIFALNRCAPLLVRKDGELFGNHEHLDRTPLTETPAVLEGDAFLHRPGLAALGMVKDLRWENNSLWLGEIEVLRFVIDFDDIDVSSIGREWLFGMMTDSLEQTAFVERLRDAHRRAAMLQSFDHILNFQFAKYVKTGSSDLEKINSELAREKRGIVSNIARYMAQDEFNSDCFDVKMANTALAAIMDTPNWSYQATPENAPFKDVVFYYNDENGKQHTFLGQEFIDLGMNV